MNKTMGILEKIRTRSAGVCLIGCMIVLGTLASCSRDDILSRDSVAIVNGEKIYLADYQHRLDMQKAFYARKGLTHPSQNLKLLEEEILESMITEKIIEQRARELHISVSNAELEKRIMDIRSEYGDDFLNLLVTDQIRYEDWKDNLRREIIFNKLIEEDVNARIRVSEDEAEDYYNDRKAQFKSEASAHVFQIVVREQARADELKIRLDMGADFSKLASEFSIGPEATRGGDLGFVGRGEMPDPIDDVIFRLHPGAVSNVIQSPYGYHIVKVAEIRPAGSLSFEESKQEVMAQIRAAKEEAAFTTWMEGLKIKAVVKKEPTVLREKVKR